MFPFFFFRLVEINMKMKSKLKKKKKEKTNTMRNNEIPKIDRVSMNSTKFNTLFVFFVFGMIFPF